jgi:hypothetical protein
MVEFYDPIAKENVSYHLDAKLKAKWDGLRNGKLEEINEDRIYIVDGRERTGKSSFAFQQAKYLDPTFTTERICFRPEDFLYQIRNAPKGSVVVFDEAFRGLSSKASRSKVNKAIVEALMEVGQRNLVIFIILPTIFLLEIYAAVFRSECLFHIYKLKDKTSGGRRQRAFKIYNYQKKKQLYLRGRSKYFSYSQPKITRAKGKFFIKKTEEWPSGLPYSTFDMKAYIAKKDQAFRDSGEKEEKEESKYKIQRDMIIKALYEEHYNSHRKLATWLQEKGVDLGAAIVGRIIKGVENTGKDG